MCEKWHDMSVLDCKLFYLIMTKSWREKLMVCVSESRIWCRELTTFDFFFSPH